MKLSSILTLAVCLSGCSVMSYSGNPDGSTSAWGVKLGTDEAIKDFAGSVNKDGSRSIKLGSADANQTTGLAQANALIGTLFESAVKGAVAGVKP